MTKKISLPPISLKSRIQYLNSPSPTPTCNTSSFTSLDSYQLESQASLLLQTLEESQTSLKPFWTKTSSLHSKKLPIHINLNQHIQMNNSWFSIIENTLQNEYDYNISSLLPHPESKKRKNSKSVRTLKGRLLPTKEEKEQLQLMLEQSRWYYNFLVGAINSKYSKEQMIKQESFSYYKIRDLLTSYVYKEEEQDNMINRYFEERKDLDSNTIQVVPSWWENKVHNRLPRGVAKKITQNLNSMITNYIEGHIRDFELRCRSTKKTPNEFILFEDKCFPSFIRTIKGQYWFTGKNGRKQRCSLQDLFTQTTPKGVEIIYEKETGKYYFNYPVDMNFYPENDRRNENQRSLSVSDKERIISLDPGIRKFMVGYDPDGKVVFIGKDAHKEIIQLLHEVDQTKEKKTWRKIKNKVSELHWKTISYLMKNYDHIMIPEFKISGMIKGKKISKQTKRMMCMYSFCSFMTKLKYKCKKENKKMYVVDESYTSKTCTLCGKINNVGGSEKYKCEGCENEIDRDVNGSRNILIKNLK